MIGSQQLRSLSLSVILAGTLLVGGTSAVLAQDEPAPDVSHPAHIHAGTCDDLDPNPAQPLNNIEPRLNDSDEENANAPQGVLTAPRVLFSETDVEMSMDDLLAESYSINVHESEEQIQNYVACGEIGGVKVDDDIIIGLRSLNDTGYTGLAILESDGDNTKVKVYLVEPMGDQEPVATPVS
jgi:hypothetical protein